MIKRFRLEQKGRYEKLVIARRLSDMLDKYLDGRPAPMFIGAEQGGIPQWDDVVVQHTEEHWEHLQIKRQTTCFSDKHVDKEAFLQSREKRQRAIRLVKAPSRLIQSMMPMWQSIPTQPRILLTTNSIRSSKK